MKSIFKLVFWITLVASVIYVIGWAFLFEAHTAEDNSMAPNIIKGDKFLVYKHATLDSGTPTVCDYPNKERKVVGRIIGVPGDTVAIYGHQVYLNGNQADMTVENPYVLVDERNPSAPQTVQLNELIETLGMIRYRVIAPMGKRVRMRGMKQRTVDEGTFILVADNRAYGLDSRVYGPVKISSCIGRAFLIYHPAEGKGDAGRSVRWFDIIR